MVDTLYSWDGISCFNIEVRGGKSQMFIPRFLATDRLPEARLRDLGLLALAMPADGAMKPATKSQSFEPEVIE